MEHHEDVRVDIHDHESSSTHNTQQQKHQQQHRLATPLTLKKKRKKQKNQEHSIELPTLTEEEQNRVAQGKDLEKGEIKNRSRGMMEVIRFETKVAWNVVSVICQCWKDILCCWMCCGCGRPVDVELSLKVYKLSQLFNTFDPSPFYEQDLDDDAEEFLVSYAEDEENATHFKLVIHVEHSEDDFYSQLDIQTAFQNNFKRRAEDVSNSIRKELRVGRHSLVFGFIILVICIMLYQLVSEYVCEWIFRLYFAYWFGSQ